jgi:hypothetical protein
LVVVLPEAAPDSVTGIPEGLGIPVIVKVPEIV